MGTPAGELHLRRLLEDCLDPARAPRDPERELEVAGEALAAVGLVDPALTVELLGLLRLARALRGEPGPWPLPSLPSGPVPAPSPAERPTGARAVAIGPVELAEPAGTLRVVAVALGPDGCTLHAAFDPDPADAARALRRPGTLRGPATRRASPGPPVSSRSPAGPQPPGTERRPGAAGDSPAATLRRLRLVAGPGEPVAVGPTGRAPAGPGAWRLAGAAVGGSFDADPAADPADPADPGGPGVRILAGGGRVADLRLVAPRAPLAGQEHRRRPAAVWVAGALDRVAAGVEAGPVGPALRALVAVGALDPTDPLPHQAALLDDLAQSGDAGALDRRWSSALERRGAPPVVRGDWVLGAFVDLGAEAVRLDSVHAGADGLWVVGSCGPDLVGTPPVVLSVYDDLLHAYTLVGPQRPLPDAAAWRLAPELDGRARSLRIDVTGSEREASVELSLR